jgi:predicted nuclease of restriction endonuclease-like (RecB) superfamily
MNDKIYFETVDNIKSELTAARNKAFTSANEHMICAYYNIGKKLIEKDTWGSKFIDSLAKDLKISLPDVKGLSARNLRYMKKFALTYVDSEILPQPVAKLSWRSNRMLLDKLKTNEERLWYANKALENNWEDIEKRIKDKRISQEGL